MFRFLAGLVLFLAPVASHAYSGFVTGRLLHFDLRVITAAPGDGPYTHDMRTSWQPVRHAKVYVVLENTTTRIGTGGTDNDG